VFLNGYKYILLQDVSRCNRKVDASLETVKHKGKKKRKRVLEEEKCLNGFD
jgi:hypothetical protein